MNSLPLITLMTVIPLIGGGVLWCCGAAWNANRSTKLSLGISLLTLMGAIFLGLRFNTSSRDIQSFERYSWIPSLNIDYVVGIDGLSLLMIALTTLLIPVALSTAHEVTPHPHRFAALVLFLEAGLIGTFTALNFFHWFLFWEISLIPAFFLIRLWGGPQRSAAAIQFFIYTFVGSIGLLLSFLALFAATGIFDFAQLADQARSGELMGNIAMNLGWADISIKLIGLILFGLAFLGVAVKVPLYPFHTWLPTTYAEAPSAVTLLLTGLMSKMGVYALLRLILPIFPDQVALMFTPLLILSVGTIVLSAFAACSQTDLKRIFAYSSINHLGYCFLGTFAIMGANVSGVASTNDGAAVINGVGLQMFNHGIVAGFIFYLISRLENRTGGLRGLTDFGGLRSVVPNYTTAMGIALFALLGLPGLNVFIGEFLIFKGSFAHVKWATAIATMGLLMTSVFILNVVQKVFTGPLNPKWQAMPDLDRREWWIVIPGLAIILTTGIFPKILLRFVNETSLNLLVHLGRTP
ncbi:MAG: NADH-quinone oxidoreductase subunit M [Verrucomicrobia subdivision 3 bacterium]|nr:NADH-quinone oxidoreductase subunit M [Limisphaerales bacterium]MCS1414444.1 NADH-quinone oxidoreductase subunit M [Limisphaerales bacterium]